MMKMMKIAEAMKDIKKEEMTSEHVERMNVLKMRMTIMNDVITRKAQIDAIDVTLSVMESDMTIIENQVRESGCVSGTSTEEYESSVGSNDTSIDDLLNGTGIDDLLNVTDIVYLQPGTPPISSEAPM
jgi:hypothetical protein